MRLAVEARRARTAGVVVLTEASEIDGCSDLRFPAQVALPLSRPILAVLVLWYAIDHWNTESTEILQALKFALIVVASAPMMVLYPFIQKHFAKGVMIGSIKG